MTDNLPSVPPTGDPVGERENDSTVDSAREQASAIKDHAVDAGGHLAETSQERASEVVEEAKSQARDLLHQTRDELRDQAGQQQQRVADGLRTVSDEFSRMARESEGGGIAAELVQNAASKSGAVADWLNQRDPGSLLDEVRRFAGRKPGMFIAIAAATGILAGRLTRSLASNASPDSGGPQRNFSSRSEPTTPIVPPTPSGFGGANGMPGAGTTTPVYSSLASDEYPDSVDDASRVNPEFSDPNGVSGPSFGEEGR